MYLYKALCFLLVFFCGHVASKDWGDPPPGFNWHESSKAQMVIPVPKNWYVKEEISSGTLGVFISKEDIEKQGKFDTGYTLNYIKDIKSSTGLTAAKYALNFILEIEKTKKVLLKPWGKELSAGIIGMGIRYLDQKREPFVVMHYYLIADKEENTLRLMIFEAPEKEWELAWETGEVMLSKGQIWK